jgi:hypothetical protein
VNLDHLNLFLTNERSPKNENEHGPSVSVVRMALIPQLIAKKNKYSIKVTAKIQAQRIKEEYTLLGQEPFNILDPPFPLL